MTATAGTGEAATLPRRRRFWVALVVVAAIVAAVIAVVTLSAGRAQAAVLVTDGGGWDGPDGDATRTVEAGPYSALVAPPRPGRPQSFELTLINDSSVSQTVLGLTHAAALADPRLTGEPEHLAVSTNTSYPDTGPLHFTSAPVTLTPHSQHTLRLTVDTGRDWRGCRSESWDGLSVQVRVDGAVRTEHLDFGPLIMELRRPGC